MKLGNFKKYAGPVIVRRAEDYLAQGLVEFLSLDTDNGVDHYLYTVHGNEDYNVDVWIEGDEIIDTFCDCPYNYSSLCKHLTAALMDIKERREAGNMDGVADSGVNQKQDRTLNGLGLTEDETFVLCYMAYSGMEQYDRRFSRLPQGLAPSDRYSQTAYEEIKRSLRRKQWMRTEGNVGAVSPARIISALLVLVRDHRDWLKHFQSIFNQSDYTLYLTDVARVIAGETVPVVHYYKATYHYYGSAEDYVKTALLGSLSLATAEQMGQYMDDGMLCDISEILLSRVLEYDHIEYLEKVYALLSLIRHANAASARLYCRYRLAVFYTRGEELPARSTAANYCESYYLDAAKSLLGGDSAGAIAIYQQGLKIHNKRSGSKNVPDDNVTFFLYVVALATHRDERDVAALSAILKKRYDKLAVNRLFVYPLVAFFQSSDQTTESSFIDSAARYYPDGLPYAQNVIAALTACFFGLKEKWTQKFPNPRMMILRSECAHYFPEVVEGAGDSWPYEPVLPRIPVRHNWELQIEELISQVHQSAPDKSGKSAESRLLYMAGYSGRHVEVREQTRLKNGWGKGKVVSLSRYKSGDCPMDDIDKRIYEEWLRGDPGYERYYAQNELPSLELVLSHLAGTDKLAVQSRGSLCLAQVREEKPFIWTEKSGGGIHFGTNVPGDAEVYKSMFVHMPSPLEYVIYRMSPDVMPAYRRILSIGHLPAESETLLGKLFEALNGRLEVHSDISGGISLPRVDGSNVVTVRITPESELFVITARVHPLEGGMCEFMPGQGDDVIYDSLNGQRMEVVRDRKRESSNLKKVNALLPESYVISKSIPNCMLTAPELLEFMEGVSTIPSVAALEWPQGKPLKLYTPQTGKWAINAVGNGGWYELEGELPVSEDKVLSVGELLSLLRESGGRYIRIGEKEFMLLSDNIRRQLGRIGYASQERRGKFCVPALAMAVMGDELAGGIVIDEPDPLLEMRERIRRSFNVSYDVPEGLNANLRYYQEEGFQWLMRVSSWGAGACLADDMGLGKTVQAIAFMLAHAAQGPCLVVAPASVVANWQRELGRFAPDLHPRLLSQSAGGGRASTIDSLAAGDVLLLTYGLLASESERLSAVKWNVACLDEAHTIKNRDTKTSAAAMKLDADKRLILTGTPVQNHLGELWNLFRFINPGLLGSYEQFSRKYMSQGGSASAAELKRLVAPFLLRRTKQEVVRELPDKEEIIVPVSLSEDETAVYEVIRREAVCEVEGSSSVSVNALSMITKLRMAACSASLAEAKWTGGACSKLDAFLDKLLPIIEGGHSVLVFSQFTSFLKMAACALDKSGVEDYLYLDGQTPVSKRQKLVDSFQRGEHKVFLISLKAGGLGLNLTGANYVIHLDPWWNPAIEQQATDRAYRIGQSQKVTVYHLISSQTIEDKILRLHATKRNLADSILEGSDANNRITARELLQLLS